MAELIKRQDAINAVAKAYRYESDRMTALQEVPTVTEAEIRAKAIDEFANGLKAKIEELRSAPKVESAYNNGWKTACEIIQGNLEVFAEQLKQKSVG